ncbi:ArsC family subfamily [Burkholderia pseudomallei 305]|nr:ArsC family subfamily [Burkholderia pseudomallei 305]
MGAALLPSAPRHPGCAGSRFRRGPRKLKPIRKHHAWRLRRHRRRARNEKPEASSRVPARGKLTISAST